MKTKLITASLMILGMAAAASQAVAANIDGFRGAKFGANERSIVEAAVKDFHVSEHDIIRSQDAVAQVTVLSIKLKELAPFDVPVTVNYVLGHKCSCLTQATVQWSIPDGATPTQHAAAMVGVSALVGRFQTEGWGKDETFVNRITGDTKSGAPNGVIFFRGQNKRGSAVTLVGAPVKVTKDITKPNAMNANVDGLKTVALIYQRDATNPDVNKVDVSGF